MLTDRLGDYMSFTFTGTSITVIGTVGVRQGYLDFYWNDQYITTIDRSRPELVCDEVLFELTDMVLKEYTIAMVLAGKGVNPNTGKKDGVLSIQRLKYTAPDEPDN
ncbi:hypothetical protein M407DRAFT_11002 [Tulasnella calospora MUT 4182]|uniref:Uncharacterized protein n=1 Tax=Tulasnella calospora MUT 4182 TaxID=1051891 RepID=A0A0C3LFI7_9AGAM|nr:hypothetical protein M407DRAFT_11002 [Tulasnella calospora MUT 4182]